ncbi:hypothetical protein AGMMS50296_2680 [Alphaproteobacteria bacterium]|nr:hypothetical protein AGMMS50296_2680 [Alphaproteobacteria bacterium]
MPGRSVSFRNTRVTTILDRYGTDNTTTVQTPEWMVSLDDLCKSTIEGYKKYTNLYGYFSESSRYIAPDLSENLFMSSAIKAAELLLILPHGEHGPKIDWKVFDGTIIKKATIVRIGTTEGTVVPLQILTFETVRFTGIELNIRYIAVSAQFAKKTNDIQVFKQSDGKAEGHKISSVDFNKNNLEFK